MNKEELVKEITAHLKAGNRYAALRTKEIEEAVRKCKLLAGWKDKK